MLSETSDGVSLKASEPFERRFFQIFDEQTTVASVLFTILQSGHSHRDVESLKVRFGISRTIVLWYFDLSWVRYPRFIDASGEGCLPSPLEQFVDLWGSAGSVMDLGFHGLYFHCSFGYVVAKVAYVRFLASGFPSLSAFAASSLGFLFG